MASSFHRQSVLLGCASMLVSTVLFALMHSCVRYLSSDIHPFEVAFFRNLIGVFFLAPLIMRNRGAILKTLQLRWHVLRAALNIVAMLMFFYALSITPMAVVQALSFTAPLFTTLLAIFLLRERVRLRRWIAIILGFTGVLIILQPGGQPIEAGALLVLGSALVWGLTMVIIKRLSNTDSPLTITVYVTMFLTLLSFGPALWFWTWPAGMQWGWLALAGLSGTLGQLCVAKAFAYADATLVLPFDFGKVIWGALLGYVLFGEHVSLSTWIGAVIIFSGATYLAFRERQIELRNKNNLAQSPAPIRNSKMT